MSKKYDNDSIQERTFTKWVSIQLKKKGDSISNLCSDFKDGIKLIKLYESLSETSLGKYNPTPKSKIHEIDNLSKVVPKINNFVSSAGIKIQFSPQQIYDGDKKQILGMIWVMICKFVVQDISEAEMSAREGLLLWCKKKTEGYKGVKVENFNNSFKDGLAFCALIHRFHPNLIDFNSLKKENMKENLELAFEVAHKNFGIEPLLDIDDMINTKPDDKAVITYVSYFWKAFASSQKFKKFGSKISRISNKFKENNEKSLDYVKSATELIEWINKNTEEYSNTEFGNSLEEIQKKHKDLISFKNGSYIEKNAEKEDLHSLLVSLNSKQKSEGINIFVPPEELATSSLNSNWEKLDQTVKKFENSLKDSVQKMKIIEININKFKSRGNQIKDLLNTKKAEIEIMNEKEFLEKFVLSSEIKLKVDVVESIEKEFNNSKKNWESTKLIGKGVIESNHKEKDEIENTLNEIDGKCNDFENLISKILNNLKEKQKSLLENESNKNEFINLSNELLLDIKIVSLSLNEPIESSSLKDVEIKVNENDQNIKILEEKKEVIEKLRDLNGKIEKKDGDIKSFEEIEDDYKGTLNQLNERKNKIEGESEKQKKFEDLINNFENYFKEYKEFLIKNQESINIFEDSEEDKDPEKLKEKFEEFSTKLLEENKKIFHNLEDQYKEIEKEDVLEKTQFTIQELNFINKQIIKLLNEKRNLLIQKILSSKQSNVSEEKLKEFMETFKYFDKQNKGSLTKLEFKAAVSSIGEDVQDAILEEVFKKYDQNNDGSIDLNEFVDYLTNLSKDTIQSSDIRQAFLELSGQKETISEDVLRQVIEPSDVCEYLLSVMKKKENNEYDIEEFVKNVFTN